MKMNKGILCFLLLVVLVLGLCACTQSPVTTTAPTSQSTQPVQPSEGIATNPSDQATEPSHEHAYEEIVTEPTCTEKGYTTVTCACGDSYIDHEVSETGHTWDEGVVAKEPAEEETGELLYTCTACGETETQVLPPLNHEHGYTDPVVVEPTCTEDGYTVYTCSCGNSYVSDETAALGHDYADATCTTPKTCNRCGRTTGNPLEHDYTVEVIEPTNCMEQGYTLCTCKNCGFDYVTDFTNGEHQFGQWQVTIEPTCTETGFQYRECSCCAIVEPEEIPAAGHQYQTFVIAPTCTEQGFTVDACEICDDSNYYDYVDATGHTEVADQGYPATCTTTGWTDGSYCSVCGMVLKAQEVIPTVPHTIVTSGGTWPTETSDGLTPSQSCTTCGMVVAQPVVIPSYAALYNDDFYYEQLGKEANGEALQELYRIMDMAAMSFHFDTSIDLTGNTVATFCYTDLGLSQEEACHVWMFYKQDHPLYYWISTQVVYSDDSIMLQTERDHWQGQERAEDNALICKQVDQYLAVVEDETSSYIIALVFHDSIITAIDYAYDSEGYPQDALWAHRVLGIFDGRGAVCEGYAQAYQLLLNAAGVENIYVVGDAGVPGYDFNAHAWNLVQLDDGRWYWCDLTWDDTPRMEFGVVYRYFCVNDTQNVNWFDGGIISEAFSFCDSHEPSYTLGSWEWEVVLPDRAAEPYQDPEDAVVREIFTVGDFSYCVSGYNTVRLTAVNYNESGTLYLPKSVTYNGRTYTVVEIGRMFNGLVEQGNVVPSEFTAVYVPKTLRFMWDGAIFGHSVEAYTVDPENPAEVTNLDHAFYGCASLTETPEIPAGVNNVEYAFCDCAALTEAPVLPNGITSLAGTFMGCEKLEKAPEIPDSVVNMGQTFKEGFALTEAPTLPSGVTDLGYTFYDCVKLEKGPYIPNGVTNMEYTFSGCSALVEVKEIPGSVTNMCGTFIDCSELTTAPVIPSSVTNISAMFVRCTKLTGIVEIHATLGTEDETYYRCFYGTELQIILTGTCNKLQKLADVSGDNVTMEASATATAQVQKQYFFPQPHAHKA